MKSGRDYRKDLQRVEQAPAGTVPPEMLHDFFKGIAWQLGGLEFNGLPDIGGACIFHALAAHQAIRADRRRGLDGLWQVCRTDGAQTLPPRCAGVLQRHPYGRDPDQRVRRLQLLGATSQFGAVHSSLRDWHRGDPVANELTAHGRALPPPQWSVELPNYWFKHREELELTWCPQGTPELGQAWYGPWFGDPEPMMTRIRNAHEDAGPPICSQIARICDDYCERRGIPSQHDDRLYPIEFEVMTVGRKHREARNGAADPVRKDRTRTQTPFPVREDRADARRSFPADVAEQPVIAAATPGDRRRTTTSVATCAGD